jgi:2,3-bisphosphoglycerate-independent phosphoglycerate mutase
MRAFRRCVAILSDGGPDRARRILEQLSDPTMDPVAKAGMKGATGAHDPSKA